MYCQQSQTMMMEDPTVLEEVSDELECLRLNDSIINSKKVTAEDGMKFPKKCREIVLHSIPGNNRCVDCGTTNDVTWASITYGILLCTRCSGRHRSYGVATSRVRSITMDRWSHLQVLAMLEGGNEQLQNFYVRHDMGPPAGDDKNKKIFQQRYHTKAAKFYRRNMESHVNNIKQIGQYKGRAASRRGSAQRRSHNNKNNNNHNKIKASSSSRYSDKTATTATMTATMTASTMKPRVMVNSAA